MTPTSKEKNMKLFPRFFEMKNLNLIFLQTFYYEEA